MISGLNSSSLSMALRTAERASKTMDKMSTQIATGKKVNSAKDDGAAYARISQARADIVRHQTVVDQIGRVNAIQEVSMASLQQLDDYVSMGRDLVLQAISAEKNGQDRSAIQAQYAQIVAGMNQIAPNAIVDGVSYLAAHVYSPSVPIANLNGGGPTDPIIYGFRPFAADSGYQDVIVNVETFTGIWPVNHFEAFNVATANAATLSDYLHNGENTGMGTGFIYYNQFNQRQIQSLSIVSNNNETIQNRALMQIDKTEEIISSLEDADIGKVSTQLQMAQTRQDLAYQTVRTAISNYGKMASGLLGNVQQSQRMVMA